MKSWAVFSSLGLAAAITFPPKCFTATTDVGMASDCPKPNLATCPVLNCLVLNTKTVTHPCPNPNCPKTPTRTITQPCLTACPEPTCPEVTVTITSRPCPTKKCYTETTTLPNFRCLTPSPTDCIAPACITIETKSAPCKDPNCPKTPTVTTFSPCVTTCRGGCATSTTTVTCKPTQ
ncbi:MAG: hypothetical protein M1817_005325 [Caeruleum heppii]|nr:MAG: hypothetical protein M1817_005325 [Caeruleum heppii]